MTLMMKKMKSSFKKKFMNLSNNNYSLLTSKFNRKSNLMKASPNQLYKPQNTFKKHKHHLKPTTNGSLSKKGKSNSSPIEWKE